MDRFSRAYPVSGLVDLSMPCKVRYEWKKKGQGELLMLSHSVHRQILAFPASNMVLPNLSYRSMDGELLGIVGDSWILEGTPITLGWYSMKGLNEEARNPIVRALEQDVSNLQPIKTPSTYFYGKAVARAARFALIAEEVQCQNVIPRVKEFLEKSLTPWLDGSFQGNAFMYDNKWEDWSAERVLGTLVQILALVFTMITIAIWVISAMPLLSWPSSIAAGLKDLSHMYTQL